MAPKIRRAKPRKQKTYVGYIEYKFSKTDITQMIKEAAQTEFRRYERQIDDYVKAIRTMQRKINQLEIQVAKLEIKRGVKK